MIRTRIGSPFVIAGDGGGGRSGVVGYEANGGFLLGFAAQGPAGPLPALMTRDSLLPLVAPLAAARRAGGLARAWCRGARPLHRHRPAAGGADGGFGGVRGAAERGWARIGLPGDVRRASGRYGPHRRAADDHHPAGSALRPSGNAPELRLYAEAESRSLADDLLARGLARLATELRPAEESR